MSYPIRPGAEPFASQGSGDNAEIGLLLIHGFTGSPRSLRPLADLLAERGFCIELPRLPGHGTHPKDMQNTEYRDWRRHAEQRFLALKERTRRQVLVGLSMGGAIALDLASSRAANAHGVVTINVQILDRGGIGTKLGPLVAKVLPMVPSAAAGLRKNDIKKGGDEDAYSSFPPAAGNSLVSELPKIRARLKQLEQPLLVLYSREDHSVPPENSRALRELVGSQRVQVIELQNSYHVATLDHDLPVIAQNVAAFAESLAKSS